MAKIARFALLMAHTLWAQANFEDLRAKADAARDANRLAEAANLYRQAVAQRPAWAEGWWNLGTLLYDQDQYAEAAKALSKAAELNPKSDVALAMLGLAEAKTGKDPEMALRHIDAAWRLGAGKEPELRRVLLFTKGLLLLGLGNFSPAQEAFGALARDGLEQEEFLIALGRSVLGIRNPELDTKAREIVRRAGWAEHFAAQREVQKAQLEYESLAKDAPKFHDVQFALGRFLLDNHLDEKAVEAFKHEIENTPKHLLARLGIAGIDAVLDPEAGLPYAEEAVKLAPQLAEAHYLFGLLLLDTGSAAKAIPELETARKQEPETAKIYFALGKAYNETGRTLEAAEARAKFARLSTDAKPTVR